ncbi:hypothetical protein [Minisyncoccus archaeiphilus]|uniref:hypothetical protein n=1 Tax=Minisyncoccus archaeiphilus TaxID=3238481 RepID=UPI00399D5305
MSCCYFFTAGLAATFLGAAGFLGAAFFTTGLAATFLGAAGFLGAAFFTAGLATGFFVVAILLENYISINRPFNF